MLKKLLKFGLPKVAGLVGLGGEAQKLVDALEKAEADPEVRAALAEGDREVLQLLLDENESVRKLLMLEVQSEDWFVRRVRPAAGWLVMCILSTYLVIIPLTNLVLGILNRDAVVVPVPNIPASVASIIITLIGFYMGARSYDKHSKLKFEGKGS